MAKFKPQTVRTIANIEAELEGARKKVAAGESDPLRHTLLIHKIVLLQDELADRKAHRDAMDRAFNSKP